MTSTVLLGLETTCVNPPPPPPEVAPASPPPFEAGCPAAVLTPTILNSVQFVKGSQGERRNVRERAKWWRVARAQQSIGPIA
jgi:hypothetical protein